MSQLGKNALWMGVMAAVAAGLGLYAWLGVKEPEERAEKKKAAEERLISADADGKATELEFTRVTLEAQGGSTTLERSEDGTWRIVAPVKAKADAFQVDNVLSQLTGGKIKTVVDEAPAAADLQRYGLSPPSFVVRAEGRAKQTGSRIDPDAPKVTRVIKGGGENTFDGSVYVQRDDDPRVVSVQGGVRWALDKSTYDLRHKDVLEVANDARSLTVKAPTHAYTLTREGEDKDAKWRLAPAKGAAMLADKQAVEQFLVAMKGYKAVAFLEDSAAERARVGLDKPLVTVDVQPAKGGPFRLALAELKESDKTRTFLLRTEGEETTLAELEPGAVFALDKDPQQLRDKTVLVFDRAKVAKVVFKRQGEKDIVVQRSAGSDVGAGSTASSEEWTVLAPEEGPGKKFKLSSILWSLGSLKATAFLEEAPKQKSPLGEIFRQVLLYDAQGKELAVLTVGAEVPGKEGTRYARGTVRELVEMDTGKLQDLPETVADVLEKPSSPTPAVDGGTAAAEG